jgi:N,N'-diacetylchitobiose transport system permease protein
MTGPMTKKRGGTLSPALVPYGLLAPAVVVLGVVLGYPLVRLVLLSVQEYGLRQQFGAPAPFVGWDNYTRLLDDREFVPVLLRTLVFCLVTVGLTIVAGMLVALLAQRVGRALRVAMLGALVLAWAMPPLSATVVWQWLFDTQYGLVNWVLDALPLGVSFSGHSWLSNPVSFLGVAALIVVWMGVPFVAITLYAALITVPSDVVEASHLDGASAWQRFRHVLLPLLKPVLLILVALSVLWNFRAFTQVYVLQRAGGVARDTNILGVFAYRISIGENRFDVGAAAAVVMLAITLALSVVWLRQMARQEDL